MKTNRIVGKELTDHINRLDIQPILNDQVRQVRWLYHNSNKCTKVYDEKLVRIIVHNLQKRIKELEDTYLKEVEQPEQSVCKWEMDEDGECFKPGCEETSVLLHGTLKDNNMKYCGFCGKLIVEPKE